MNCHPIGKTCNVLATESDRPDTTFGEVAFPMMTAATETRDLIPDLCGHFSQISGWEMQFTATRRSPTELRKELESRADCCWLAGVGDANRPAGFLHLVTPADDGSVGTSPG